ncbi:MAG: chemotaxis protein CheW [Thiolinea sp.]
MGQTAFCYRTGDYHIVLEGGIRSEILPFDKIYPVPFAPQWCVGLAGVRGELFPVLDMHRVLLNQPRPKQPYLLWLKHDSFEPIIIGSDSIPAQIEVNKAADDSGHIPGLPGWIRNTWSMDGQVYLEADHGRLFRTLLGSQKR